MSPDHCPWTQIRLGAGTPNARLLHRHVLTRRQRDDLNHNVFTSSARPPGVCGGSAPASRSFVLAALRALHLDPGPRPHRPKPGRGRGQTTEKQQKRQRTPTFTGVPITDKETDHGYAHGGDGFEDGAVLGRAQHRRSVRQSQDVGQQQRSDDSVEHLGVDDECDEVTGGQGDGGADNDLHREDAVEERCLPQFRRDGPRGADSVGNGVGGRQRHHRSR
jgi:hypothetical protein